MPLDLLPHRVGGSAALVGFLQHTAQQPAT
jgi:hypothetical protein